MLLLLLVHFAKIGLLLGARLQALRRSGRSAPLLCSSSARLLLLRRRLLLLLLLGLLWRRCREGGGVHMKSTIWSCR